MLRLAVHLLVALLLSAAPGFWLWSRVRFRTRDPFLAPVVILGGGLSLSMAALWILYAFGLHTHAAQMALLVAFGVLGLLGICRLCGHRQPSTGIDSRGPSDFLHRTSLFVFDLLALVAILLFSFGLSKCVLGHPFEAWDAVVSWDKWAEDIARRRFLGGYVSGGYPPGLPLLGGVFYGLLQPEGVPVMLGDTARILPALYAVFPVLLGLSLLSLCRSFRLPSPPIVLLVFGNGAVLHCMVKHLGYADVPQMAFLAAALAWLCACREPEAGSPSSWSIPLVSSALLFATAFTKGNGFILLLVAVSVFLLLDRRRIRPVLMPVLAALALAGLFYLHQWIVGVWWPDLAETSPFHQALPVMATHKDLVTPDRTHFLRQVGLWASYYGISGEVSARILCVLVFGFLLAALVRRPTRAPAAVTLLGMALVFRAGSYDARNALFLLVPASLLVVGVLCHALGRLPGRNAGAASPSVWRHIGVVVAAVLLLACLGRTVAEKRFQAMLRAATNVPLVPAGWSEWRVRGPVPRDAAIHDFLEQSPMGRRAAHIRIASPQYRWHARGVYPLQQNRGNDATPGDLAFSAMHGNAPLYAPSSDFVPFARVSGRSYGDVLFVLSPTYADISSSRAGEGTVAIPASALPMECANGGFFEITSADGERLPDIRPRFGVAGFQPLEGTDANGRPCLRIPFAEASSYALDAIGPIRVRVGY